MSSTESTRDLDSGLTDAEARAQARAEYQREGECEIDDNAVVSHSTDGGAYVQAWVWVEGPNRCEECDRPIPTAPGGGLANKHHTEACSLYDATAE